MSHAIPLNSQQQAERATLAYRCSKSLSALKQQQQSKPKPVEYYAKPATSNSQVSAERQALEIRAENSRRAMEVAKMFDYDAQVKSFPNVSMVSQPFDYEALVSSVDSLNDINMEREKGICQLNLTGIGCSASSVSQIMGALQDYEILVLNSFFQNFVTWLKLNSTPPIQPLVFVNLVKRYIADKVPDISTYMMNALNVANGGISRNSGNSGNGGNNGDNDQPPPPPNALVPSGAPPPDDGYYGGQHFDEKKIKKARDSIRVRRGYIDEIPTEPKAKRATFPMEIPDYIINPPRLLKEKPASTALVPYTPPSTPQKKAPKTPTTSSTTEPKTPIKHTQKTKLIYPPFPLKYQDTPASGSSPESIASSNTVSSTDSYFPLYETHYLNSNLHQSIPPGITAKELKTQITTFLRENPEVKKLFEDQMLVDIDRHQSLSAENSKVKPLTPYMYGLKKRDPSGFGGIKTRYQHWQMLQYLKELKTKEPIKGKGLHKRRIIKGKGSEMLCNNGRGIDLDKLKQNILRIANAKTNKTNKFQPFAITDDAKEVITDLINDKFDERYYKKLHPDDQSAVKQAIIGLGLKHPITKGHIKQLYADWEIARGEICSGNDNPQLRTQLKKLTIELQHLRRIPVGVAKQVLDELA